MADAPGKVNPAPGRPSDATVGRRRLADLVAPAAPTATGEMFGGRTWMKIAVLAALMLALHYRLLDVVVRLWITDSNWTHGFIIPLFSLYLLYARREELFAARRRTTATTTVLGLGLMALAMAAEVIAVFRVRNHWLAQMAMVGMLFGLVLWLGGWQIIRMTWLPILFLVFALPIPELIYSRVAVPLQNISAEGAVAILRLKVPIASSASRLDLYSRTNQVHTLTVAEACSGMRLLMAFLALGVAMAYLDYKPIWQRVVLVAAAIPIAVFCNVIRVAITCWMYYIDKPELGKDFMHYFTGMLMLIPAFLLLWLLAWILRNLFVEESDEDEPETEGAPA